MGKEGKNNAQGLFGVQQIPSDGQMQNTLAPVDPAQLREPFWEVYALLKGNGIWSGIGGWGERYWSH